MQRRQLRLRKISMLIEIRQALVHGIIAPPAQIPRAAADGVVPAWPELARIKPQLILRGFWVRSESHAVGCVVVQSHEVRALRLVVSACGVPAAAVAEDGDAGAGVGVDAFDGAGLEEVDEAEVDGVVGVAQDGDGLLAVQGEEDEEAEAGLAGEVACWGVDAEFDVHFWGWGVHS